MSQVELLYEGGLSTLCNHPGSGLQVRTSVARKMEAKEQEFSPTDLFAVSLGACVLTVMGLKAEKLGVDFSGSRATVFKEMSLIPPRRVAHLMVRVICPLSFSEEIQKQLEEAGKFCPVHHSLHPDIKQEFHFTWGSLP